jgi:hypothetical protein
MRRFFSLSPMSRGNGVPPIRASASLPISALPACC